MLLHIQTVSKTMQGFLRLIDLDPHATVQITSSMMPPPSCMVEQAGYGPAYAQHLCAWRRKVETGQATNGVVVALRSFQHDPKTGTVALAFTPHAYVEHRSVRDLCAEMRPTVDPFVVSLVWSSGFPLFLVVIDEHGNVLATRRSATVAVAPNRISLAFTEGSALEDLVPDLPVAMVKRCLLEELGLDAPSASVANAMSQTCLVLDAAQTQWGLFSLVYLDRLEGTSKGVAHDAWESSAMMHVPFTKIALTMFADNHADRFAKGGHDLAHMLISMAP